MNNKDFKSIFVKFDEKRGISHQLFIKQHKVREETDERPSDLTLFVCNVPSYCTEEYLKCVFEKFGPINAIYLVNADIPNESIRKSEPSNAPKLEGGKGYQIAYVVFHSAKSVHAALSTKEEEEETFSSSLDQNTIITGLKKWCLAYNTRFPDRIEMQKEIDLFMAQYDENEKHKKTLATDMTESAEDGWIAVSKKSRNPTFARKQSVKDKVLKKMNRKKQKKALLNFYNFQIKESKMNHLVTLRKKFEDDKKKVEALKTQRKFKPF